MCLVLAGRDEESDPLRFSRAPEINDQRGDGISYLEHPDLCFPPTISPRLTRTIRIPLLWHSDVRTTEIYSHLTANEL